MERLNILLNITQLINRIKIIFGYHAYKISTGHCDYCVTQVKRVFWECVHTHNLNFQDSYDKKCNYLLKGRVSVNPNTRRKWKNDALDWEGKEAAVRSEMGEGIVTNNIGKPRLVTKVTSIKH